MATRKRRSIAAILDAVEAQCQAEYERETKQQDIACGQGRITLDQRQYNQTVLFAEHAGQNDIIRRLRMILGDESESA